jgi:hypothetical protein
MRLQYVEMVKPPLVDPKRLGHNDPGQFAVLTFQAERAAIQPS